MKITCYSDLWNCEMRRACCFKLLTLWCFIAIVEIYAGNNERPFFSMVNVIFNVSSIFIFLLRKWLLVEK